jgi:hypothetical protein
MADEQPLHPTMLIFPIILLAVLSLIWMMWQMSGAIDYSAILDSVASDTGQTSLANPSNSIGMGGITDNELGATGTGLATSINQKSNANSANSSPQTNTIGTNSKRTTTKGGLAAMQATTSGDCSLGTRFPNSVRQWCGTISSYASQYNVPANLVAAVIWQESGGNPTAYSHSGAVGLMQVMARDGLAASFTCNGQPCFKNRPSIVELEDPEFNIQYGVQMLSDLIATHGNFREALRAYGPMDVGYYYADTVLAIMDKYGN